MSFEDRIAAETLGWVADGLISDRQAEAIQLRYARGAGVARRGRLVTVLSLLGALAVGAGVILFIAANWDAIPRFARLLVLVGATVAALLGGDRLARRTPRVGEAVCFLGGLLCGASIFLVGQMYHLGDEVGLGFLLWSIGAAAGTAVFRSAPWATLAVATLGACLAFEVGNASDGAAVPFVLGLYGFAVYAAATRLRRVRELGLVRGAGYLLGTLPAFALTFAGLADEPSRAHLAHRVVLLGAAAGIAALVAAGLLALDAARSTARWEALGIAAATGTLLLGTQFALTPIAFNVIVILLAVGAVAVGYENDEVWLVNLGIAVAATELVVRFFDWFWHFLPRSAAFIATGLFLLLLAWAIERQRSRLIARMRAD